MSTSNKNDMAEPVPVSPYPAPDPIFSGNSPSAAPRSSVGTMETDIALGQQRSSRRIEPKLEEDDAFHPKQSIINRALEHPLQLVLGVAVISFVAGIALRLWRVHHD